ncbi:MAG TPA: hypothetical protein VIH05_10130 [Tepidiformaceae bacterium]
MHAYYAFVIAEVEDGVKRVIGGRGQRLLAAFLIGLVLAVLAGTQASNAEGPTLPDAGSVGYDISWPQCDGSYPQQPVAFGIVGVNGGRAYTRNRCLESQWRWASEAAGEAGVYINLNYPKQRTLGTVTGPAGTCTRDDRYCQAYNYGYNAARSSISYARAAGVETSNWWLDIETMNYWSDDKWLNRVVIAAAIDHLLEQRMNVGIYSTPYQWGVIAGDYAPGLPVWTAGALGLEGAKARCNSQYAFGGGTVRMVQWVETYDMNYVCP